MAKVSATESMRRISTTFFLILLILAICGRGKANETTNRVLCLWYSQPAEKWTEALPVGNGRMGAMVFGGIADERIQFNEDTLWKGLPHNYDRAGAHDHLAEIRKLLFDGKTKEAADI